MAGRRRVAWLAVAGLLLSSCAADHGVVAVDGARTDDPVTTPATPATTPVATPVATPASARGLTAALLAHLDQEHVTWYGGAHYTVDATHASWSAAVRLDEGPRSVYLLAEDVPGDHPSGCDPDDGYVELSCTTSPGGADLSLMAQDADMGLGESPILMGRTTRDDGTTILVELFGDRADEDAEQLVLELLGDEAIGSLTTQSLETAGEELDDFHDLKLRIMARSDSGRS